MNIDYDNIAKMLDWLKEKIKLNETALNAKNRLVKRGQVYQCNFGYGVGSEMCKNRPAVIIQNDIGNLHSTNTIVIPLTHDDSRLPCVANIIPQKNEYGTIFLDGQANASNILCVSKARLGNFICLLPKSEMRKIDEAIAKSVDIMSYYSELSKKIEDKKSFIQKLKPLKNHIQNITKNIDSNSNS